MEPITGDNNTEEKKITGFRECEIASCIDHTTTDLFDLSAEELRFLCRYYRPKYDAVYVLLPPLLCPKVVAPTAHGRPNSRPPTVKLLTPSQSPHLILDNVHGPHHDHHDHDDANVPVDMDEDDGDDHGHDHDDADTYSVTASSVGSNDYVSDDDMVIEDDAVSSARNYV